ncbi:MAG TPA: recombinase family protein [Conexibacter sp.]|nr:recombinase family protein [Conexibacter sp.]
MISRTALDGYVRVSRRGRRAGPRFLSPRMQRRSIAAWATEHDCRIVMWHTDMSRSGGTMRRPGLQLAIRRVKGGATGGIVVASLDRFARTVLGGIATVDRIHQVGGRVVSVRENVDPETPSGRMHLSIVLLFAEWQRSTAREAFEATIASAAAQGRFAVRDRYGYRRTTTGRIVPDPETAPVVAQMVALRAAGRGWQAICTALNKQRIPTPTGRTHWGSSTVIGIVRSEALLGVWNGPFGHRIENAWEPIVDRPRWLQANAARGVRDDTRHYRDRAYAGLARCAVCRRTLVRDVDRNHVVRYRCKTVGCAAPTSIAAALLDAYVDEQLEHRLTRWREILATGPHGDLRRLHDAHTRASRTFENWRDDTTLRQRLGNDRYREGLIRRFRRRDEARLALVAGRVAMLGGLELEPMPRGPLVSMTWRERRQLSEAAIHAIWIARSDRRGIPARRDVSRRVLIEFADAARRHKLPQSSTPATGTAPVFWE